MITKTIKKIIMAVASSRLRRLRYESGLFAASRKDIETGYNNAWLRDNIYESLGLMAVKDRESIREMYHRLFDYFIKHEAKIDRAIKRKPSNADDYLHPRFCPFTLKEFDEPWGNKQNDAVGAFLFQVGELYRAGYETIRNEKDIAILQKLVSYLESIQYWKDPDNGMWEEAEELHASSIGACVAGLKSIRGIVDVNPKLISKGIRALQKLLPNESPSKFVDLALLSLIYPYNVVSPAQRGVILKNVEKHLVRKRGVARYLGDRYYYLNGEAEWCFGFPWLAKIYKEMGNKRKYFLYLLRTLRVMKLNGDIPELYYASSRRHNQNTPLGWTMAMSMVAIQ